MESVNKRPSNEIYMEGKAQERKSEPGKKNEGQEGIHPAILRTNCAVSFEAAPLLCTKTTMKPSDFLCFLEKPGVHEVVQERLKLWRHNPLRGMGYRNEKGAQRWMAIWSPTSFPDFRGSRSMQGSISTTNTSIVF